MKKSLPYDRSLEIITLLKRCSDFQEANQLIRQETGLQDFFSSSQTFTAFIKKTSDGLQNRFSHRGFGDFQTPESTTEAICAYLYQAGIRPDVLIEPSCGAGNFVLSGINQFASSIKALYCLELQEEHLLCLKTRLLKQLWHAPNPPSIELYHDDIFKHSFSPHLLEKLTSNSWQTLVIGNPPWITTAELSSLDFHNEPDKLNIKSYRGIEAMTGKGHFDIAEAIILKLLLAFKDHPGYLAMLCKTSVMRSIIKAAEKLTLPIEPCMALLINAKKIFNIKASACLFVCKLDGATRSCCSIYFFSAPEKLLSRIGTVDGYFVADVDSYRASAYIEGHSCFEWRQGIKHDATSIMIVKRNADGKMMNALGDTVDCESAVLFPFIKSSQLRKPVLSDTERAIIITQHSLSDDTAILRETAPRTWAYLEKYGKYLDARKSRIYNGRPRFAIFGVGSYAFSPYKVAIAGMYRVPQFSLLLPVDGKPVMPDDTSYYLAFNTIQDAVITWLLLQTQTVKSFLASIVFPDNQRPYTKDILMRIDLLRVCECNSFESLHKLYLQIGRALIPCELTEADYMGYKERLKALSSK